MVLAVGVGLAFLRLEEVEHQARLAHELGAIALAFLLGEVVVQQVVAPAEAVEQVPGREVDVGLVVGVAPDLVADRGVHVLARGGEVLRVALDLVRERGLGDAHADLVLHATLLCRRLRWFHLQRAHVGERALPDLAVRGAGLLAQLLEPVLRDVNARVHALELAPELRVARAHEFRERVHALEPGARGFLVGELARVLREDAGGEQQDRAQQQGAHAHSISIPPLISMVSPTRKLAASEARNVMTLATSSGVPTRPSGMFLQ